MTGKMKPEREPLKAHAITLRKQGWTERAISKEIGVSRECISDWVGNNGERVIVTNRYQNGKNGERVIVTKDLHFQSFLGPIESLQTDIRS